MNEWLTPETHLNIKNILPGIEGILPKGPYRPCVSMAGRALLAGYHRYMGFHYRDKMVMRDSLLFIMEIPILVRLSIY